MGTRVRQRLGAQHCVEVSKPNLLLADEEHEHFGLSNCICQRNGIICTNKNVRDERTFFNVKSKNRLIAVFAAAHQGFILNRPLAGILRDAAVIFHLYLFQLL